MKVLKDRFGNRELRDVEFTHVCESAQFPISTLMQASNYVVEHNNVYYFQLNPNFPESPNTVAEREKLTITDYTSYLLHSGEKTK